jgi:hypothetical protein
MIGEADVHWKTGAAGKEGILAKCLSMPSALLSTAHTFPVR